MATVEDRASSAQGDLWLGKLLSHEALGFCYFKKIHWGGHIFCNTKRFT